MWIWIPVFILGILLIGLLGRLLSRKDTSNAGRLMEKYKQMTPTLLEETPDEELVKAVVANLLAKAEGAHKDAYAVIPTLSQKRCAVYSVWLFAREIQSNNAPFLRRDEQFGFSELAADGLDLLGFSEVAADLRDYLQTEDDARVAPMKALADSRELSDAMIALIRNDPDDFCDKAI